MNIESMNTDNKSIERPEDEWIERFSSWLIGGLVYRLLPGKWGKEVNSLISTVIGYDLKKLASLPPKMFNNLLYDLFYEKQYKEYWNSNREEIHKNILRQTELFGINAKLSNMDIDTYLRQWIEGHSKEAMEIPGMIETALEHSQMLLGEAKGGDIIEYYKDQVLALMNWKEIYSRAYGSIADQKHNQKIPRIAAGSGAKSNENKILSNDTSLSYSISDLNVNEADFEKGISLFLDNYAMAVDIMSSLNPSMDVSSMLGENYADDLPGFSLFQSAGSSAGSGFTMGSGITIPLEYDINISGLEEFGALNQAIDESSKSLEQTDELAKNAANQIMEQYQNLTVEQVSLNAAIAAFNVSGITIPFLNISTSFKDTDEEANIFGETLMDIADIAGKIGGAFMNVDENIGKVIGSAGELAGGISKIYTAMNKDPLAGMDTSKMTPEQIEAAKKQGEKQNGLAIMSGIQGGFAGLQGLFGGEGGSDTSQLLGGLGGMGTGVAGLLTGNPLEGIQSIISSLPSLIDGLTESTQEGYVKQLSKQGFNDTYSEDLLDKMSEVSDKMGDKSFGIKAYIEDFFKETNIDTNEEFSRMSDLLNESIGEYVSQGHTMDEAYDKFGDELGQLTDAQEKYGYETTASLDTMIEIQKTETIQGIDKF